MTLKQYRSNPALVEYAATLFASSKFKELLEAVRTEHPKNWRVMSHGLPESDHAVALGRVYGFDEFDNTLMSAAIPEVQQNVPLHATFIPDGQPEEETEK